MSTACPQLTAGLQMIRQRTAGCKILTRKQTTATLVRLSGSYRRLNCNAGLGLSSQALSFELSSDETFGLREQPLACQLHLGHLLLKDRQLSTDTGYDIGTAGKRKHSLCWSCLGALHRPWRLLVAPHYEEQ